MCHLKMEAADLHALQSPPSEHRNAQPRLHLQADRIVEHDVKSGTAAAPCQTVSSRCSDFESIVA